MWDEVISRSVLDHSSILSDVIDESIEPESNKPESMNSNLAKEKTGTVEI